MKKLITILAVSSLSVAAFAQGTVQWTGVAGSFVGSTNATTYSTFSFALAGQATGTGTAGTTLGNSVANNAALGFGGFYYALLAKSSGVAAPTTVAGLSGWLDTGLSATNAAASNGRIVQVNPLSNATANNWASGGASGIILAGWSANLGTTYAAALAAVTAGTYGANSYFGVSSFGNLVSGTANPGVIVFGSNPGQINNGSGAPMVMGLLGVSAVPEPGTMVLAGLGGLALLGLRRKK